MEFRQTAMSQKSLKISEITAVFDEHEAEVGQAKTRLWMTLAVLAYLCFRWIGVNPTPLPGGAQTLWVELPTPIALHLLWFYLGYLVFGFALLTLIRSHPGHFKSRRVAAMLADYSALTYSMVVGELPMMPMLALILWVTVGNGMRFGSRYLALAAVLAQASLLALLVISPFWRDQIAVIVTSSLTAVALPAYSVILLRHTARARDAAMAAMQSKSRFLAQASHDLRQPIHSIGYYLDMLRTTSGEAERARLLGRIERALGSVSRLFKSLLDIAHLDSGTVEVRSEHLALKPLIAELVQQNSQSARWLNTELRVVQTRLNVQADPTLLATMIQNLLSNAIKYSPGSRVLIGVRRRGDTLAIEVHDQGIGIAPEHMPHILDEFYRGHVPGDRDSEGVGLGLAIVNRLAQLSGLTLGLKSRRGIGTIAGIYGIPISAQKLQRKRRSSDDAPQPLSDFRVILIEDNQDVLDATQALLERWGCHVQAHASMPTVVHTADLIIADFDLGDQLLGTDAIATIRKKLGSSIPAILMTGHAGQLVNDRLVSDDIQILAKPVQPAMLRSILSAFRIGSRQQH